MVAPAAGFGSHIFAAGISLVALAYSVALHSLGLWGLYCWFLRKVPSLAAELLMWRTTSGSLRRLFFRSVHSETSRRYRVLKRTRST